MQGRQLRDSCDARKAIKACIETEDSVDPVFLHDGQMHSVTCGQARMTEDNPFRAIHDGSIDGKNVIDDPEQGIKRWLNGVTAVDGYVAVQDLLEDFRIRDQSLAAAQQFFHQSLRVDFMGVRRSHQIHRNVGIDQNHDRSVR
jgi:hypothetical protein